MRSRISDLLSKDGSTCRYIVYLDTDAWFQEILTPVDEWLGEIGQKYGISKDVAVIASKEEKPPDEQMRVQEPGQEEEERRERREVHAQHAQQ